MKTRAFLLALPLLAVAACTVHPRASVEAQAICAMPDNCSFQSTCTNVLMGNPALDASMTNGVLIALQVENQLPDNKNVLNGQLNTNDAHIDGYELEYGAGPFGTQTIPTNQYVPANGSTVIRVDIVPGPAATLATFAGTAGRVLPVNVRLRGYLDDGTRFETGDFPVAVGVCTGCIGTCPTGTTIKCPPDNEGQLPRACK